MSDKENVMPVYKNISTPDDNKESAKSNTMGVLASKQQQTPLVTKSNMQETTMTEEETVTVEQGRRDTVLVQRQQETLFDQFLHQSPLKSKETKKSPSPSLYVPLTQEEEHDQEELIEQERRSASPPDLAEGYTDTTNYHFRHHHEQKASTSASVITLTLEEQLIQQRTKYVRLQEVNEKKKENLKLLKDQQKTVKEDIEMLAKRKAKQDEIVAIQSEIEEQREYCTELLGILCELDKQGQEYMDSMKYLEDQIEAALNELSDANFKISELSDESLA